MSAKHTPGPHWKEADARDYYGLKTFLRDDGVRVFTDRQTALAGGRPWAACRGQSDYLRGRLYAGRDVLDGPVRKFSTAHAAMKAVDEAWPRAAISKATGEA
ncbi:MAG TPA: hypothetical protein VIM56_06235 [Rhizomicrobium sp.]